MAVHVAVGAHIGDMELTAGPALAAAALAGHRAVLLALTPGERGHPRVPPREYAEQKLAEGRRFAAEIGAEFEALDYCDGYLSADPDVIAAVTDVFRRVRPDVVFAHWPRSIHPDHEQAAVIAERARLHAGLPDDRLPRHGVRRLLRTENWEDEDGFRPTGAIEIPAEAYRIWAAAIAGHAFARGETYGFRYIDYYTALMTLRGCRAGVERAVAYHGPASAGAIDVGDL